MITIPDCRRFSGYKPCDPYRTCPCDEADPFGERILIVNLDFIGDVMMTTALLPSIARKYEKAVIHWITKSNAVPVLKHNPYLFRIWEWNDENRMILESMTFDLLLNADKNVNSAAFSMQINAKSKCGFGLHENGFIVPLNSEAEYNFQMGLDDELKFKKNQRTGLDILAQTWKLNYEGDEYVLVLSEEEKTDSKKLKERYGLKPNDICVGFNTGCSSAYPIKKMSVEHHIILINRVLDSLAGSKVLLLGGQEDSERNAEIAHRVGRGVIETPTVEGLRKGIVSIDLCDLVVTGDTLGKACDCLVQHLLRRRNRDIRSRQEDHHRFGLFPLLETVV